MPQCILSSATVSILLFVLSLPYFIQIGERYNVPDAVFKIISLNLLGACFARFVFDVPYGIARYGFTI